MSSFTTPLEYEPTGAFSAWRPVVRLTAGFTYHVGDEDSGIVVDVPAGFETDFASVPRATSKLIRPDGVLAKPGTLHDYLYRRGKVSRLVADLYFWEAMGIAGVPLWERICCFLAVRFFGGSSYGRLPTDYSFPVPAGASA